MTSIIPDLIDLFKSLKVLVIGEAMVDTYIDGAVRRVCKEAPCPVVDVAGMERAPGGAANTAVNIRSMGAEVAFLSVIGDDAEGENLRKLLNAADVDTAGLIVERGRSTLVKSRVSGGPQMLLRFDQGTTAPVGRSVESELIRRVSDLFAQVDSVVVSDYGYGLLTPASIGGIERLQASAHRTIVVDSKRLPAYRSLKATAVKPNIEEATRLLALKDNAGPEEIALHGDRILDRTGARVVAVTLDSKGALFFERGSRPYRTYARPARATRAIGAGDTFSAALALSLTPMAPTWVAAEIASAAAAIAVGKDGTAACSAQELHEYFSPGGKRIAALGRAGDVIDRIQPESGEARRRRRKTDDPSSGTGAPLSEAQP